MKTSDYKDLEVWKQAIQLTKEVYILVRKLPKEETYVLSDQIRRAAVSVPSNIAEGKGRESDKEYLHFLSIAYGSICELETQIIIGIEIGYFTEEDTTKALDLCSKVARMLKGLSRYLKPKA